MLRRACLLFLILAVPIAVHAQIAEKTKRLFEGSNFEELKIILVKVGRENSYFSEAQYYLRRIAVEEKDYEASIERFEEAIKENDKVAEYHNWLGVMYAVMIKDANPIKKGHLAWKIKNEFDTAVKLDPHNLQAQWGLIHYFTQAPGFMGGSWEKAFGCAKVIAQHNAAQGSRARGFIHGAQKKTELAEKEFFAATVLDPASTENAFALGHFYEENHLFVKACAVYEDLRKKNPNNKVALYYIGRLSAQNGSQFEKGLELLNEYVLYKTHPNEPSHSSAFLAMAMIYEKKGNKTMARTYYQNSLRLEPGLKEASEGLKRVNSLSL